MTDGARNDGTIGDYHLTLQDPVSATEHVFAHSFGFPVHNFTVSVHFYRLAAADSCFQQKKGLG